MNKIKHVLLLAALGLVPACGPSGADAPPPLAGAKMGGAFALVNQDGQRVSDQNFKGKYRLVYFGYTFCPDVCPTDVQTLMRGFSLLETQDKAVAAKIQPLFITVDPERDTPVRLKEFVSAFHPRLIGLTGTSAEIATVAKRYAVVYQRETGGSKDNYMVDHSRTTILYGPDGAPLAIIAQDGMPGDIANELRRWVR
jgi:protein SCO1/2